MVMVAGRGRTGLTSTWLGDVHDNDGGKGYLVTRRWPFRKSLLLKFWPEPVVEDDVVIVAATTTTNNNHNDGHDRHEDDDDDDEDCGFMCAPGSFSMVL